MFDNLSISLYLFTPLNSGNWEVLLLRGLRVSVIVGQYCENYSIGIEITLTQAPGNLIYFMTLSLVIHKFFIVSLEPLVYVY